MTVEKTYPLVDLLDLEDMEMVTLEGAREKLRSIWCQDLELDEREYEIMSEEWDCTETAAGLHEFLSGVGYGLLEDMEEYQEMLDEEKKSKGGK